MMIAGLIVLYDHYHNDLIIGILPCSRNTHFFLMYIFRYFRPEKKLIKVLITDRMCFASS